MSNQFRQKGASRKGKNGDWKSKIWTSNIFSILLIILLFISFVKVGKEIMLRYEIKKEVNTLQVQLEDLQGRKSRMDKLISYLRTDEYIEKQARLELNLSKPGEKQINLLSLDNAENKGLSDIQKSNTEKWFNYFFD
jgi:cell division protein FtsB